MAFRRLLSAPSLPAHDVLTGALVGIGFNLAAEPLPDANLEDTLYLASVVGLEHDDLRTLAILTTWLGVHADATNVERLKQLLSTHPSARVRAYWSGVGRWLRRDSRFAKLAKLYTGTPVGLLAVGTEFQIARRGEDTRFAGSRFRVPAGVLRDRTEDVLSPKELAARHRAYRWRIVLGPTFRADMWAALQATPGLTPAELARQTYGSFATAWDVKQSWQLLTTTAPTDLRPAL